MGNWKGIYNQDSVIDLFEKLISSSKIPHAFLFSGISGIGKTLTALRFAQNLNTSLGTVENVSFLINAIDNYEEPYIKYIFPIPRGKNENDDSSPYEKLSNDEINLIKEEIAKKINNPYYHITIPKANLIKVNSIRDIRKFVSLNYEEVKYRFVIISDAHLMNDESQNALLKNLEEPPEGIIFILITPFPELLRRTIISRCWNIHFKPLSSDNVEEILIKYFGIEKGIAEEAGLFSNGSVDNALSLVNNDLELLLQKTISILRFSFAKKYHSALNELSFFTSENSTEMIKILIDLILYWLNDLQKFRSGEKEIVYKNFSDTFEKFNLRFPNMPLTEAIYKLDYLKSLIQGNINLNIIGLSIIFELSSLT